MKFGRTELYFILLIIAGIVCGPWIIQKTPPEWLNAFDAVAGLVNAIISVVIFVKVVSDWKARRSKQKEEQNALDKHRD